jgi:dephospho-CoA kinase
MKVLGVTGNSGSGKSTVSKLLQCYGGYIIDADKINHKILKPKGLAYEEVVNNFTCSILDESGNIDKKKLSNIVFFEKNKLDILVSITHKYIIKYIIDEIKIIKNSKNSYKFIVIDAALLIESGLNKYTDSVWLVYQSYEERLKRIKKRDILTNEEIIRRFKSQTSFEELKKHCDIVIYNEGTLEELQKKIEELQKNI